jgi:hypothetical protein
MRSAIRSRALSCALAALFGAGCTKDQGTGLLLLSVSADGALASAPDNKVEVSDPRGGTRTWVGLFPPANQDALLLQVPDLLASDSPVLFTVQAFASGGCPISDPVRVGRHQGRCQHACHRGEAPLVLDRMR